MGVNLSKLADMPGPAKVVVMLASGAGLTGILTSLGGSLSMVLVIVVGLALAGLIWAGFRWFLKWREKGKSTPFLGKLLRAAGGTPQGVAADPAKRARLDDLRKKFEEGVEKFRSAGKNVYSLPWYLLVGPSGAGKTEAIRHCNVGFPPGLQDYLQGAGGTLNMHWWFTNHAVIIDTAGKMFMEEVGAGESSEWKEFLKLLKDSRGIQPINGMLLCIGVDSLIKDSADEIQEKAGKIARQLDLIQRTLDVRFPVYVLVTKCDLITGFREFFEKVTDPQLQHQIMGWSNPAQLDEAFAPEKVDQHIETVRQRLLRRRFAHLIDPVHTDDPQARRTDQVDSLFALPDSMQRLSSRLRRYLELIFVAGEWSPKPLFLRGIYFTSSMRQGAELDEEVAKILGMPVDALPGGGIAEERSYFLRDVFTAKVFKERGLVTRATSVTKQQRSRKLALVGTGIACVLLLMVFTVWSYLDFRSTVETARGTWKAVADRVGELRLVDTDRGKPVFYAEKPVTIGADDLTTAEVVARTRDLADHPPRVPWVLRPLSWVRNIAGESLADRVKSAHEAVVRNGAVRDLVEEARARFNNARAANPWESNDRAATGVLAALLSIERGDAPPEPKADPKGGSHADARRGLRVEYPIDVEKFFLFLIPDDVKKEGKAEGPIRMSARTAQEVITSTYAPHGWAAWPPKGALDLGSDPGAAKAGVDLFIKYWEGDGPVLNNLGELGALKTQIENFAKAEDELAALARTYTGESRDDAKSFTDFRTAWDGKFTELETAWKALEPRLKSVQNPEALEQLIRDREQSIRDDAADAYRAALGEEPADPAMALLEGAGEKAAAGKGVDSRAVAAAKELFAKWPDKVDQCRKDLVASRDRLLLKDKKLDARLADLRTFFGTGKDGGRLLARAGSGDSARSACQARYEAYQLATKALARGEEAVKGDARPVLGRQLAQSGERVESDIDGLEKSLQGIGVSLAEQPKLKIDKDKEFGAVFRAARRHARYRVIEAGLSSEAPTSQDAWARDKVKALAGPDASGPIASKIRQGAGVPLLAEGAARVDAEFNPDAAGLLFRDVRYLLKQYPRTGKSVDALEDPDLMRIARTAYDSATAYASRYAAFWSRDLIRRSEVTGSGKWSEYRDALAGMSGNESVIAGRLRSLGEGAADALRVDGLAEVLGESADKKEGADRAAWAAELGKADNNAEDTLRSRLRGWRELAPDMGDAKNAIGNKSPADFKSDYLQAFSCATLQGTSPTSPLAAYLDGVRLGALRTIADEIERERARNQPVPKAPLRLAPQPEGQWEGALTPEAVRSIRTYSLGGGGAGPGAAVIASAGSASKLGLDCVDAQLDRLFAPKGALLSAGLGDALNKWVPFTLGETAPDRQLKFRLSVIPDADTVKLGAARGGRSTHAQGVYLITQVSYAGSDVPRNEVEGGALLLDWTALPLKGQDRVKISFAQSDKAGAPRATRELKSVWGVLELLGEPDSHSYSDKGPGDDSASKSWAVPVVFDGPTGQMHKWLRVDFNAEVPAKRDWPTPGLWGGSR